MDLCRFLCWRLGEQKLEELDRQLPSPQRSPFSEACSPQTISTDLKLFSWELLTSLFGRIKRLVKLSRSRNGKQVGKRRRGRRKLKLTVFLFPPPSSHRSFGITKRPVDVLSLFFIFVR